MLSFLLQRPSAAPALIRSDGTTVSRDALAGRVWDLAARLPVGITAVIAEDPVEMVVGVLAGMARGAAAPGSTRSPAAIRADWLARVRPTATVVDGVVTVREGRSIAADVSLVLSTSGSSGVPKDVLLGGDGLRANIDAILDYLPIHGRPAVVLPPWYGYALIGQVFASIRAGGSPILLSDVPYAADQLARMRDLGADSLSSVASSLRWLAEAATDRVALRFVASAGEALPRSTAEKLAEWGEHVYNQYGLTEASPRVAAIRSDDPGFWDGAAGYPLRGVRLQAGTAADPGPILVAGPSVMRGYLDDADGTAEVLANGWLTTGDIGWLDDAGRLFVLGREDDLVKVSGERVSLVAVEQALIAAGALAACVVAVPSERTGTAICAAIVADPADPVRSQVRERLAPHQRPSRWQVIPALPVTPNGKADRVAVRALFQAG